jgi:hypothetical protein
MVTGLPASDGVLAYVLTADIILRSKWVAAHLVQEIQRTDWH